MIDLKTARYKGVEFAVLDMPTTGGNRLVKYNFPGSDKQAIERQGLRPKTYTLTAVIPHDDYFNERDSLLRVLDSADSDTLTHPTFGDVENVICEAYTLTEKISELGRATLSITFAVDDAAGVPQEAGALAAQVQAESDALNEQLTADLADGLEVTTPDNFADAREMLNNVRGGFNAVADYAQSFIDDVSDLRNSITSFTNQINTLIQTPAALAAEIGGLFDDVNNLIEAPGRLLGGLKLLASYGSDDPEVKTDTAGRVERKQNRDVMRAAMRGQALSYSYLAAASVSSGVVSGAAGTTVPISSAPNSTSADAVLAYTTADDVEATQAALEVQYRDMRDQAGASNAALEQLDRVRTQAQKTMDSIRLTTPSIITIETPVVPLSVLVYQYYGSTELVDTIAELNNIKQNAFVEGEVRILSL